MIVDLWFPVRGPGLPSDHGYSMYSALCRAVPEMHEAPWWGLHTLWGQRTGDRRILLPRGARLGLRLPADKIGLVLPLAGRTLDVAGNELSLSAPTIAALEPAGALSARIVTIKGFTEPDTFLVSLMKKLGEIGVSADAAIGARKVVRVDGAAVVGFSIRLVGLDDASAIKVQEVGLGGRRRFGCGVFRPSRHMLAEDKRPGAAS